MRRGSSAPVRPLEGGHYGHLTASKEGAGKVSAVPARGTHPCRGTVWKDRAAADLAKRAASRLEFQVRGVVQNVGSKAAASRERSGKGKTKSKEAKD